VKSASCLLQSKVQKPQRFNRRNKNRCRGLSFGCGESNTLKPSCLLYPYHIEFISCRIHIRSEVPGPYRVRMYLNIFKKYNFVSYFWPALKSLTLGF
jgi:hypothetical protein